MTILQLVRYVQRGDGVFGWLNSPGFSCFTVERPWLQNQPKISCVPAGTYPLVLEFSDKFSRHLWELKNVPGRSEVKIHPANRFNQLEGCIGLGASISQDAMGWFVTDSRAVVDRFMEAMKKAGGGDLQLNILDAAGPDTSLSPGGGVPPGPR